MMISTRTTTSAAAAEARAGVKEADEQTAADGDLD